MRGFHLVLALPLLLVALAVAGVITALVLRVPLEALMAAVASREVAFAVWLSLKSSVLALGIALVLGVPAAWVLARCRLPGQALIDTLLDIPLVMPPLVAGVGLLLMLSRSMLGAPLARLGFDLLFSPVGIVVAQAFIALPLVIRSGRAAFAAIDPGMAQMAATLGARPADIWVCVELPLAARGIAAGAVMAWSRALGEFGATLMVAGATRLRTETLPLAVYLNMATGDIDMAVACALVLMALAAVLLVLLRLLGGGTMSLRD